MKFKLKSSTHSQKEVNIIKKIWTKQEPNILQVIHSITGLSLNTDKIICYIDYSTSNGYYGSRTITLGVKGGISKDDALMVIAHELLHIFYWKRVKKLKLTKSSPGKESKIEWKLAEVAAYLITSENKLKKYWPNAEIYLYPEIRSTYKKVKKFWKHGNLDYFLINSYNIIEKSLD